MTLGRKRESGFTYLEVMVGVVCVMALSATALAAAKSMELVRHVRNEDIALRIAENKIEDLRALGYAYVGTSGSFTDSNLSRISNGAGTVTISAYNAITKLVVVTVSWVETGSTTRSVSLTTLLTQVGGL